MIFSYFGLQITSKQLQNTCISSIFVKFLCSYLGKVAFRQLHCYSFIKTAHWSFYWEIEIKEDIAFLLFFTPNNSKTTRNYIHIFQICFNLMDLNRLSIFLGSWAALIISELLIEVHIEKRKSRSKLNFSCFWLQITQKLLQIICLLLISA